MIPTENPSPDLPRQLYKKSLFVKKMQHARNSMKTGGGRRHARMPA
jgi:hypothetical protein